MPLDLNQFDIESLTEKISRLRPGQSLITNEGIIVRRRHNSSGYDMGVGAGGHGARKCNTPAEAARDAMRQSAKLTHPKSLGGEESFDTVEQAIEAIRKGDAATPGPSPAIKALRRVANKASLHSYSIRAQDARDALAQGDVSAAVRQLEAIMEHAGAHGRGKDAARAQMALDAINEHHDYSHSTPELKDTEIKIVPKGGKHHVYVNGNDMSGPLTRSEAEARQRFLQRNAARAEAVAAIDKEVQETPDALKEEAVA